MIFDSVLNDNNYKKLGNIAKMLEFLKTTDFSNLEKGRHEVDGDNIYFMVQEYETKVGGGLSESHDKYIDIQYIVEGTEIIGVTQRALAGKPIEENPEKDYALYECDTQRFVLNAGDFAVFFPNDVHMPGVSATDVPTPVKKVVVKVKI